MTMLRLLENAFREVLEAKPLVNVCNKSEPVLGPKAVAPGSPAFFTRSVLCFIRFYSCSRAILLLPFTLFKNRG